MPTEYQQPAAASQQPIDRLQISHPYTCEHVMSTGRDILNRAASSECVRDSTPGAGKRAGNDHLEDHCESTRALQSKIEEIKSKMALGGSDLHKELEELRTLRVASMSPCASQSPAQTPWARRYSPTALEGRLIGASSTDASPTGATLETAVNGEVDEEEADAALSRPAVDYIVEPVSQPFDFGASKRSKRFFMCIPIPSL